MTLQVAQKDHRCTLCGGKIPKGHKYWRLYETDECGDLVTDRKEHTNCEAYRPKQRMETIAHTPTKIHKTNTGDPHV